MPLKVLLLVLLFVVVGVGVGVGVGVWTPLETLKRHLISCPKRSKSDRGKVPNVVSETLQKITSRGKTPCL